MRSEGPEEVEKSFAEAQSFPAIVEKKALQLLEAQLWCREGRCQRGSADRRCSRRAPAAPHSWLEQLGVAVGRTLRDVVGIRQVTLP